MVRAAGCALLLLIPTIDEFDLMDLVPPIDEIDPTDLISIIGILFAIILAMLPFSELLNKSELKPDWEVEKKRRDDELIRRLKAQAWSERNKRIAYQRDVYDTSFGPDEVLTEDLIESLHIRPLSLLCYHLKNKNDVWKLYPNKNNNHVGLRDVPVKAVDYLTLARIGWFN